MTTINEKRQHNLRLPISRIPNEILSTIFCDLRGNFVCTAALQLWPRQHLKNLTGWVAITYVCHAWREVALNTSLLWCHIGVSSQVHNWIPELLRRSKQSLLTIAIDWAGNELERDLVKEVKKHLGRARELEVEGVDNAIIYEIFSSESQTNFQNLEALDILPAYETSFILDDSHLRAERLRSLNLHSCAIDWNSKFLRDLTHLRLVDIPQSCSLDPHDFILVLSKIPALKTLYLSDSFFENEVQTHWETHRATKIHLQHLQQLHMKFRIPELAQFLSSLVVPRSCKLSFHTWSEDGAICDKFRAILSWISNHFRAPTIRDAMATDHEQYIQSVYLEFYVGIDIEDFQFKAFSDVLSHEQLETADPVLEFIVDWSYEVDNSDLNLRTLLSLLPLSGVAFLDASNNALLSPEFWMVAFGSIQTLKTVYLRTATAPFWQALITPANNDNGTIVKSPPFPALTSFTVEEFPSNLSSTHSEFDLNWVPRNFRTFASQVKAWCRLHLL